MRVKYEHFCLRNCHTQSNKRNITFSQLIIMLANCVCVWFSVYGVECGWQIAMAIVAAWHPKPNHIFHIARLRVFTMHIYTIDNKTHFIFIATAHCFLFLCFKFLFYRIETNQANHVICLSASYSATPKYRSDRIKSDWSIIFAIYFVFWVFWLFCFQKGKQHDRSIDFICILCACCNRSHVFVSPAHSGHFNMTKAHFSNQFLFCSLCSRWFDPLTRLY